MTRLPVHKVVEDSRFLFGVTFAAAVLAFVGPLVAYDLWWHLKAGRLILSSGAVPAADPFSFTAAGRPWTYHSWLSGLVLTGAWGVGGATGLVLLRAFLMAASLMVAWAAARKRGVGAGLASVLVLAACLQLKLRALARPYLFSFLLFMVFALILQSCAARPVRTLLARLRRSPKGARWLAAEGSFLWGGGGRLILLPILTVLWANLHAGFIVGMLLIGAFGAGEMVGLLVHRAGGSPVAALLKRPEGARLRALFVTGVLCLAASVITPHGPWALLYPFRLLHSVKLVKSVQEWQPMPFALAFGVFWAMLILGAVVVVRSVWSGAKGGRLRREIGPVATDVLLMGGFAFLAVQSVRHMAWFLLLAPSLLGWHLSAPRRCPAGGPEGAEPPGRKGYAYVACLLALVVGVLPLVKDGLPRVAIAESKFPVNACDYMAAEGLKYRLYNSYEWGGYLIWRFWPEMKVFIDGRCLVYGDRIIGQAIQVEDGRDGWERTLDDWQVEMFLVRYRKRDSTHLFASRRWRCVYWDDVAVIGLREDVFEAHQPPLPDFQLSNPVLFEEALSPSSAADALGELDVVVERDPECWTALGLRARCLVELAGQRPDGRDELLRSAFASAQQAVKFQDGHHEPWLALREVAEAMGDAALEAAAAEKVQKLRPADDSEG